MNTRLAQKLVEIGKMNEELTPREWYNKTIKFERTKKIVKNIFRKQILEADDSNRVGDNLDNWNM